MSAGHSSFAFIAVDKAIEIDPSFLPAIIAKADFSTQNTTNKQILMDNRLRLDSFERFSRRQTRPQIVAAMQGMLLVRQGDFAGASNAFAELWQQPQDTAHNFQHPLSDIRVRESFAHALH